MKIKATRGVLIGFLAFLIVSFGGFYHWYNQKVDLIPREILFSNPEYTTVRISGDGKWLSYLAPKDGILNIWVRNLETGQSKLLTHETKRSIGTYRWAFDNEHILYSQDEEGDENTRLYSINIHSGVRTLLTPSKGVRARIFARSYLYPNKILVGLNDRDPVHYDIYAVDIATGKKTLVLENKEFRHFLFDDDFNIVLALKSNSAGGDEYYKPVGQNKWELYRTIALQDKENTGPIGLDIKKEWVYWYDSEGSDKSNLVKMHLKTKDTKTLAKGNKADITYTLIHPITKEILAVGENYLRWEVRPLVPDIKEDFEVLEKIDVGEMSIVSNTVDYKKWVVVFEDDISPSRYYLYDIITKRASFLFYKNSKLRGLPLVNMKPIEIKSRDGLTLVSYLSMPKTRKRDAPIPMVLTVHGGPIGIRDVWGLNKEHQYWANRGYAVLSVNYRGSGGFGKKFIKAAYGEYGRKMHDDLIDAVNWAIKEKIADPKKIAIMGGSYGGYATLVGAAMTPDVFACAIATVGMSNLITALETIPPYWQPHYESMKIMYGGDPKTEEGRALLRARSPLTYADNISKPLLIMHGNNDPRVKKSESDQIVEAMKKRGIPVTYVVFPDEGHGWLRKENQLADAAISEAFLAKCLGGKLEPLKDEIRNSSAQIIIGKGDINV